MRYNSNIEIKSKQPVPLNSDHTHFLMIDDGYRSLIKVVMMIRYNYFAGTTILAREALASSPPNWRR